MNRTKLPNGLEIFENTAGETAAAFTEIFEDALYSKHGLTLADNACVFDVGAHIGLATLYFHTHARAVRIYAFEPSPATFRALTANVDLHAIDARLFNVAISNRVGEGTHTFYPGSPGMSGLYGDPKEETALAKKYLENRGADPDDAAFVLADKFVPQAVRVPVRTLEDVIAAERVERIDLLKVDVEKSEADVLAGLGEANWEKIRQFVAEVHDIEGRLGQLSDALRDRGFRVAVDQDPTLIGTNVYVLYATRA